MLVEGTHFLPGTDPESLGWKALAVNLSDLAAMGATPRWALLALALPQADEAWLAAFSRGFFHLAGSHQVDVVGGDTTRGPLALCPTVLGELPEGVALTRTGAGVGDDIWVSGQPGRAALGLAHLQGRVRLRQPDVCVAALQRPQPRLALGQALLGLASACLDVSDGLLQDLGHLLAAGALAAELLDEALPWQALAQACDDEALCRACLLGGGDDYELLFCAPPAQRHAIVSVSARLALPLHRIGRVCAGASGAIRLLDAQGRPLALPPGGYDHFPAACTPGDGT